MTTDPEPEHDGLDLEAVRDLFEASTDFTVGIEEEFAILDPAILDLEHRFEEMRQACLRDPELIHAVKGELIDTEIEIRSGRGETFADAAVRQRARRERLFGIADEMGLALAAMGTHPWANYSTSTSSIRSTTAAWRETCAGSRSGTTPGACTCTSGSGGPIGPLRSLTGCASSCLRCSPSRRTRRSSTTGTPACTPCARRSSRGHSPAAASTSPSATGGPMRISSSCWTTRTRSSRRRSSGGASGPITRSARSRSGSATPRRVATSRSTWPP